MKELGKRLLKGRKKNDTGYWMLDAGYWMLDAGCRILDAAFSVGFA